MREDLLSLFLATFNVTINISSPLIAAFLTNYAITLILPKTFEQAVVAEKMGARKTSDEGQGADDEDQSTTRAAVTNASADSTVAPVATEIAASISATAVSSFCCVNSRCRNFLKGVGSAGSADLLLVRNRRGFAPSGCGYSLFCVSVLWPIEEVPFFS